MRNTRDNRQQILTKCKRRNVRQDNHVPSCHGVRVTKNNVNTVRMHSQRAER